MKNINSHKLALNNNPVTRLTTLWALSESMLGGLLHAARVPFRGMIISSIAVIIICLIAYNSQTRGNILKAAVLVLAVKAGISPHTPVAAYAAVFLQVLLGELFFFNKRFFTLSSIVFGILVGILTGLQKIITLTIIFGNTLWEAINQFVNYVIKEFFLNAMEFASINFSFFLVVSYVSIHILSGMAAGIFASRIPVKISSTDVKNLLLPEINSVTLNLSNQKKSKKGKHWWKRPAYLFVFFISIGLLTLSYLNPEAINLNKNSLIIMLIRGFLIIIIWFYFLSPSISKLIQRLLNKSKNEYSNEITQVIENLQLYKSIAAQVWKLSSKYTGVKRMNYFLTALIVIVLNLPEN